MNLSKGNRKRTKVKWRRSTKEAEENDSLDSSLETDMM